MIDTETRIQLGTIRQYNSYDNHDLPTTRVDIVCRDKLKCETITWFTVVQGEGWRIRRSFEHVFSCCLPNGSICRAIGLCNGEVIAFGPTYKNVWIISKLTDDLINAKEEPVYSLFKEALGYAYPWVKKVDYDLFRNLIGRDVFDLR